MSRIHLKSRRLHCHRPFDQLLLFYRRFGTFSSIYFGNFIDVGDIRESVVFLGFVFIKRNTRPLLSKNARIHGQIWKQPIKRGDFSIWTGKFQSQQTSSRKLILSRRTFFSHAVSSLWLKTANLTSALNAVTAQANPVTAWFRANPMKAHGCITASPAAPASTISNCLPLITTLTLPMISLTFASMPAPSSEFICHTRKRNPRNWLKTLLFQKTSWRRIILKICLRNTGAA